MLIHLVVIITEVDHPQKVERFCFCNFFLLIQEKYQFSKKRYNHNLLDEIEREIYKFYNPNYYFEKH